MRAVALSLALLATARGLGCVDDYGPYLCVCMCMWRALAAARGGSPWWLTVAWFRLLLPVEAR